MEKYICDILENESSRHIQKEYGFSKRLCTGSVDDWPLDKKKASPFWTWYYVFEWKISEKRHSQVEWRHLLWQKTLVERNATGISFVAGSAMAKLEWCKIGGNNIPNPRKQTRLHPPHPSKYKDLSLDMFVYVLLVHGDTKAIHKNTHRQKKNENAYHADLPKAGTQVWNAGLDSRICLCTIPVPSPSVKK